MPYPVPPSVFFFSVQFGFGDTDNRFQEVSGLTVEMETEAIKEGGENRFTHNLPVRSKYTNLSLKRGLIKDSKIIDWCKKAFDQFIFEPRDIVIMLRNSKGENLATWNVTGVYPIKWSVSNLDAMKSELVIETLVLSYKFFTFNNEGGKQADAESYK